MEFHDAAKPSEETLKEFAKIMLKSWTPELQAFHEEKMRRKRDARYVYFILDSNLVKVGFSADPEGRLLHIQTSRPRAKLLGYIKGGTELEKEIHRKLKEYKYGREWFFYEPKVQNIIDEYFK